MHIIGFNLDYSETDLWYLLSYKKKFYETRKISPSKRPKSIAYLFQNSSEKICNSNSSKIDQKIQILQSFNVKVESIAIQNSDYQSGWSTILEKLKTI